MTIRSFTITALLLSAPLVTLHGQRYPQPVLPNVLRDLVRSVPLLLSDSTDWVAYPRGDGRTLWVGAARIRPVESSRTVFAIVDTTTAPKAWLIGSFTGFGSYDKFQRILVNRDDVLVFDQEDNDYGWTRQRFVFWLDVTRGMTIASRELREAPLVGWGRRGGVPVPMVRDGPRWVVADGLDLRSIGVAVPAGDGSIVSEPDTGAEVDSSTARRTSVGWSLAGDPTVVIQDGSMAPDSRATSGPGRIGQVHGGDTAWTMIPLPEDSVRVRAWTYQGIYSDYDFNEGYGHPVRVGDRIFAGVGFDGGEGANGVGGLLEYSIRTRNVVVHRWPELIHRSAGVPLIDRDTLWMPLYYNGEYGTYGGGVLVLDLTTFGHRHIAYPDPVSRLERVAGHSFVDGGTSLGLLTPQGFRRWVIVPDARGEWTTLEVLTAADDQN